MLGPGEEMTYFADWNLNYATGDPVPPGDYQVSALIDLDITDENSPKIESEILNFFVEGYEQDIMLKKGWNFVSLPCQPVYTDLPIVLKSIWPYCRSVWAYDSRTGTWMKYAADNPPFFNILKYMEKGNGYWIEVSQDAILHIMGRIIEDTRIHLWPGWNFTGFNSTNILPLDIALSSIQYKSIYTYDNIAKKWIGRMSDGPSFLNNLTQLEPGGAYCIYVDAECIWDISSTSY